jgi:hypothetical protein
VLQQVGTALARETIHPIIMDRVGRGLDVVTP